MKTAKKAEQLQFLRFCAFLLIFLFHSDDCQPSYFPHQYGSTSAVCFFVLLSGFVSGFSSYDAEIKCDIKAILHYMWKKLKKVYPLYFTTTIVMVAYSEIPNIVASCSWTNLKPQLIQLFKCLFLIQAWFPEDYLAFNGVSWFLSMIMFLYILNLPLRATASRIKKSPKSDYIFLGIFVLSYILTVLYCFLTRNTIMGFTQYAWPVSRIGEYLCGMSMGYLAYSMNQRIEYRGWNSCILFSIFEAAVLVLSIYVMYVPMDKWVYCKVHWMLPNCILIFVFSFGKGIISKILKMPLLRYLGDISFECYLLHIIVIKIYRDICGIGAMTTPGKIFSLAFCLMITIMFSALISQKKINEN